MVAAQLFLEESANMKDESWRDPLAVGIIKRGGAKPRYSLSEISGYTVQYSANPGGDNGVGQLVFALNTQTSQTLLGCCYQGNCLIPWGICCYMCCFFQANYGPVTACVNATCIRSGFCMGSSSTCYLALGSNTSCGATLFRRIV